MPNTIQHFIRCLACWLDFRGIKPSKDNKINYQNCTNLSILKREKHLHLGLGWRTYAPPPHASIFASAIVKLYFYQDKRCFLIEWRITRALDCHRAMKMNSVREIVTQIMLVEKSRENPLKITHVQLCALVQMLFI